MIDSISRRFIKLTHRKQQQVIRCPSSRRQRVPAFSNDSLPKCRANIYKAVAFFFFLSVVSGCGSGAAAKLPAATNDMTVFLGDSITAFWKLPKHNAGVPGETTAQIQARFQRDIVGSGLRQVIILTGANDVRKPRPNYSEIMDNIQKMVEQGRAADIKVILCEITPITCCDAQVRTLNGMIKNFAIAQHLTLVDYYTPMAGQDNLYLEDGLHPSSLGYAMMENTVTQTLGE